MCYMNMQDTDVTMTDRAMALWYNPSLQCPKLASTIISDRYQNKMAGDTITTTKCFFLQQ